MIFFWTILWLLLISSLITTPNEEYVNNLNHTFRHDFKQPLSVGNVLVWRITGNPETVCIPRMYETQIPQFKSNETYLLFTQTQNGFRIYYWVGRSASLDDKKATAKYALKQYLLFSIYTTGTIRGIISREEESIESESFKNMSNFIQIQNSPGSRDYRYYLNNQLPSSLPNLYVLKGEYTTRIKHVSFGTQWLKNDTCLLLENGYMVEGWTPINTYCGPYASPIARGRTQHFQKFFTSYYIITDDINVREPLSRNDLQFKIFVEVLEDISNRKSNEMDNSNEHTVVAETFVANRDNDISLYQIYDGQLKKGRREINKRFTSLFFYSALFHVRGCHLFDDASVSGLFLFIRSKIKNEEKLKAIQLAESYIYDNYASISIPKRMRIILYEHSVHYIIDINVNLLDFPPNEEFVLAIERRQPI